MRDWAGQPTEPGISISRSFDAEQREELRDIWELAGQDKKKVIELALEILGLEDILENENNEQ